MDPSNGVDWASLLGTSPDEKRPVVVIAPSGTGKSTEMQEEARRRSSVGEMAIFAPASSLVDGIAGRLRADDSRTFQEWSTSSRTLLFFIDAVDELYLRRRSISELFQRLELELNPEVRPVRFVFSARNGSWTAAESRDLNALLGNPLREDGPNPSSPTGPRLVSFEPIDDVALRRLAETEGVRDVDKFMTALDADEIDDLVDLRPSDVALLVGQWNTKGAFGPWSQVLAEFARQSFTEGRPAMARTRVLPPIEGHRGLLRMAAATTLMKGLHVTSPTMGATEGTVSARRLFNDWPLEKLVELFENPLLVHKGANAEAVQLPQGLISHFLAAQWLIERVRAGRSVSALCKDLFVRVFDDERRIVPESLRIVVGWVASEVSGLRTELLPDYPEIVLYEGDPDRLGDAEIVDALRATCERLADGRSERSWPSRATFRKLARPTLEPQVAALLKKYAATDLVLEHLLRFVEMGRYASCVSLAAQRALTAVSPRVRSLAIAAVNSAGDATSRESLMPLVDNPDEDIQVALLHALVPELLHGDHLVRFLSRGGGAFFANALETVGTRISVLDLDATLLALHAVLANDTISDETERAFQVAVPLLCLRVAGETELPSHALDIMEVLERLQRHHSFWFSEADRLIVDTFLLGDADARRELWRRRFAAAQRVGGMQSIMEPIYGDAMSDDVAWLFELGKSEPLALGVLRRISPGTRSPENPPEAPPQPEPSDEVRQHLQALAREREAMEQEIQATVAEHKRRAAGERAELERDIEARRAGIESGEDGHALIWAWDQLRDGGSDGQSLDPVNLRSRIAAEYVELFLRGIRASWRKHDVGLPALSPRLSVMAMVGLAGITLDVRSGIDLASISASDARRAATYAMHALNKLPTWFGDLFRSHAEVVREVLREAIGAEWAYADEHHGVLRLSWSSSAEVTSALRAIVLDLLNRGAPAHQRTAQYAVDVLLTSATDGAQLATIARRELAKDAEKADGAAPWLRLWAHVEPIDAAAWLSGLVARTGDSGRDRFLETAVRLEQDLDGHAPRGENSQLMTPTALGAWIRLLFRFAPPEEDPEHSGFHRVETRDYVQRLRERCVTRLANTVTREAHGVLQGLIEDSAMQHHRERLERIAERQIAVAAEAARPIWTEEDVVRVEQQDEKQPRSLAELWLLVRSHLSDVARLVMNDDFSYRGLFSKKTKEREIQLWVASCLKERARGLYSVVRENVVDDDKEVDISAFAAGIGTIPVEIKPLGDYSAASLSKVLQEQLLGRYMQPPDRRFGILLLVRRDKLVWQIEGRESDLGRLVEFLRSSVEILGRYTDKTICVESIDLLPPKRDETAAPGRRRGDRRSRAPHQVARKPSASVKKRRAP